jgi:hypothetical protein
MAVVALYDVNHCYLVAERKTERWGRKRGRQKDREKREREIESL